MNGDAFQIYRGMDIGTAKPTPEEQTRVPHHVIDMVDIHHAATLVEFHKWADTAIAEIIARNKIPILVGGSGLYVRAILDGLDVPPTDPTVRDKYNALLEEIGSASLHARLEEIDPVAAASILPGNTRRVVRALEVNELTGQPFAATLPDAQPRFRSVRIGLDVPRERLRERMKLRIENMLESGWQAEVAHLDADGLQSTPTASKALGYREISQLNAGQLARAEAIELITAATAKFGKRQMQWFKRDKNVQWFAFDDGDLVANAQLAVEQQLT